MPKRDDPAWRKEYQHKYYLEHRDKAIAYQKQYNIEHKKPKRGRVTFRQVRLPVLFELHQKHLMDSTGDRLVRYVNDIIAGKRMLV